MEKKFRKSTALIQFLSRKPADQFYAERKIAPFWKDNYIPTATQRFLSKIASLEQEYPSPMFWSSNDIGFHQFPSVFKSGGIEFCSALKVVNASGDKIHIQSAS